MNALPVIFRLVAMSLLLIATSSVADNNVTNAIGMTFVTIPAGHFQMGITEAERQTVIDEMEKPDFDAFKDEQPQHNVIISKAFLLGETEVTQGQWLKVMENKPGPKEYWQHDEWETLPVVSISWNMAKRFTEELSKMDPKYNYRLPTEAEWEYAARAGTKGDYWSDAPFNPGQAIYTSDSSKPVAAEPIPTWPANKASVRAS